MKLSIFHQSINKSNNLNQNDILVLFFISLLGLIHLSFPFSGDQALFTIGALKISLGGVLYRDFWDLKQPGIYWFYCLAGKLFGFNEIGIHTFETLYFLVFSIVSLISLKHYYRYSFTSSCVPVLTVGIYFSSAGSLHLTQLEALVGFPIFLVVWFAYKSTNSEKYRKRLLFISGFLGGIVLLFKLLLLPIIIFFWVITLLDSIIRKKQGITESFFNIVIPLIIGILIPLLTVIWYFESFDILNLIYKTFIEFPPRIFREISHAEIGRLFQGIIWFTTQYMPVVLLGLIGIYISFRRSIDLITIYLTSWIIIGFLVILMQRQSWWEYHYQLLFIPFGILSLRGIESCWDKIRIWSFPISLSQKKILIAIVLIPLFIFSLKSLSIKSFAFLREGFTLKEGRQFAYKDKFSGGQYKVINDQVSFLKNPESQKGDIYVLGNPLYYLLSGRNQAISINGWALEFLLPEQWIDFGKQLSSTLPEYIFISGDYLSLIKQQKPEVFQFLKNYQVLNKNIEGVWYDKL